VPRARRARAFIGAFTGLFPQLKPVFAAFDGQPFCCLRPVTPDGPPILGRSRYANLWYNVGQGHLGWTLAHGCARILTSLIAGRDPGIDMTGYAPRAGM
jgi:D-amino-acid dehydrogenase